jgi:hypothetical protein
MFNRAVGYDSQDRYDLFVSRAQETGIPVFDAREALRAAGLGEEAYYRFNHHWKAAGHRAAAGGLREFLIERGLLTDPA